MDRHALEENLRLAGERLTACQESLLLQRRQVRELERSGLDAGLARDLLRLYEESRDMALAHRRSLAQAAQAGHYMGGGGVSLRFEPEPVHDLSDDSYLYRWAA